MAAAVMPRAQQAPHGMPNMTINGAPNMTINGARNAVGATGGGAAGNTGIVGPNFAGGGNTGAMHPAVMPPAPRPMATNTGIVGPNMHAMQAPAPTGALKTPAIVAPAPAPSANGLPDWANNPANADLSGMAGQMKDATTYKPTDDALVSAQLDKLLAKDSSYMQLARTRALQSGAANGLLNSSMTAGAGELAAIQSAMPIAQQDAQAYFTALRDNAAAQNQFGRDANEFSRQGALARFSGTLDVAKHGRDLDFQREELGKRDEWTKADLDLRDRQLSSDNDYRNQQLGISRDELAMRRDQGNRDLDIRGDSLQLERDRLIADRDYRDRQLDISEQDLSNRAAQAEQQSRLQLSENIRQIRQQALDAQRAIETDPKMDAASKARAIEAISNNAAHDIAEVVRFSGLDMPGAWPDWINVEMQSGASGAAPPPPPPAPPPGRNWGDWGS
jgi:hypothetical protein